MERQPIWQPCAMYHPGHDFCILLDAGFARGMYGSRLSGENQRRMQELPKELMGFVYPDPYVFHKGSCLLSQINLNAGEGQWLSLDDACGGDTSGFTGPLRYSTHNFDTRVTASDVMTVMGLFDIWVEYSSLLRGP